MDVLGLQFVRTFSSAIVPEISNDGSIGYDLKTPEGFSLNPREYVKINIGIALEMNSQIGIYPHVFDRSSMAAVKKVNVQGGVIDPNDRSPIVVALKNNGKDTVHFRSGDAIAQMIFLNYALPKLIEVEAFDTNAERRKRGLDVINRLPYLQFVRTFSAAIEPKIGNDGSIGYDLKTPEGFFLNPQEDVKINTGIALEMDSKMGFYPHIFDKPSIAASLKVNVQGGVIDPNYRGSIIVALRNTGKDTVHFRSGEAIAQMIFLTYALPKLMEVEAIDTNTERGKRGFGGFTYV